MRGFPIIDCQKLIVSIKNILSQRVSKFSSSIEKLRIFLMFAGRLLKILEPENSIFFVTVPDEMW